MSSSLFKDKNLGAEPLRSAIKLLGAFLRAEEYDAIYKSLRWPLYHFDPWAELKSFEKALWVLPRAKQIMFHLFMLGTKVPYSKAVHFIKPDVVDSLIELGLIQRNSDDQISLSGFSIIPYRNFLFLVDLCYTSPNSIRRAPEAYIGADSYICSNFHFRNEPNDRVLDLCCGPGFQLILTSSEAQRSVGVEISPFAKGVCEFNVILNNLEERVQVEQGNLYAPVQNQRFTTIYANPPFIPVPEGVEYPVPGDGGEDGTVILEKIYRDMDRFLVDNGRSLVYCECLGDEDNVYFFDTLRKIAAENSWRVEVFVMGKVFQLEQMRRIIKLVVSTYDGMNEDELIDRWERAYGSNGKTKYLYSLIIKTYKENVPAGAFHITNLSNPFRLDDQLLVNPSIQIEAANGVYSVMKSGFPLATIDHFGRTVVESGDGITLREIVSRYLVSEKASLAQVDKQEVFQKGIATENLLKAAFGLLRSGAISRKPGKAV